MIGYKKTLKLGLLSLLLATSSTFEIYSETLKDALRWSYESNPNLNSQRAQVKYVAENIELAKAGKRPQLNLKAQYGATNSAEYVFGTPTGKRTNNDGVQAQLTASMMLWDNGQTELSISAARAALRSAQAKLAAYEQQILLDTVSAYLSVLESEQQLKLQNNSANILDKQVSSASVSFEEGASTLTELSAAKASAASAQAAISVAEANLETAKQGYKLLTGRLPGDLAKVSMPKIPSNPKQVEQEALKFLPSILAAVEYERQSMYNLRGEERNGDPTISGSLSATRSNPLDRTESTDVAQFGVVLNVPIYSGGVNSAKERQARAALESAAQGTNVARAEAVQGAANAWALYQNSLAGVSAYGKVVEAQALANEGAAIEFDLGGNTIVDKLEAEQNLLSAQTNELSAKYQQIKTAYGVLAAMGKLNIGNLVSGVQKIDPVKVQVVVPQKSEGSQAVEKIGGRWERKPNP